MIAWVGWDCLGRHSVYFSATLSCYCARNKNKNIAKCHPSILSLTSFTVSYMSWFLVDFSICHAMLVATLIQYLPLNIFFLVLKVLNYWRQFFCRVSPFNQLFYQGMGQTRRFKKYIWVEKEVGKEKWSLNLRE